MFEHDADQWQQGEAAPAGSLLAAAQEAEAALRRREGLAMLTVADCAARPSPRGKRRLPLAMTLGGALLGAVCAAALSRLGTDPGMAFTDPLFAALSAGGGLAGLLAGRLLSPTRSAEYMPPLQAYQTDMPQEVPPMHRDQRYPQSYPPQEFDHRQPVQRQPVPALHHPYGAYPASPPQYDHWAHERPHPHYPPYAPAPMPAYGQERRFDNDDGLQHLFDNNTEAAIQEIRRTLRELRQAIEDIAVERRRYG